MNSEETAILKWHEKTAKDTFNAVWDLMEKKDRTEKETLTMIHMAHTSVYHWSYVGEPVNMARGEWLVSRVYSVSGKPESALYHGLYSLKICLDNDIVDFDLAFGYEAVARAYNLAGNKKLKEEYRLFAETAADSIEKESDRNYFLSELSSI